MLVHEWMSASSRSCSDLHETELGRPVSIASDHGLDECEVGLPDTAQGSAVVVQGDFTGENF
jgi:hypothetical protein